MVRRLRAEKKEPGWIVLCVSAALLYFFAAFGIEANSLGINYKEVAPGVYQTPAGCLHQMNIPANAPVVYKVGDPNDSGYIRHWWKYVQVVYVVNKYDPRVFRVATRNTIVYRTKMDALLDSGKIVGLSQNIDTVIINGGTDVFWLHDHYGKPQPGFETLAKPEHGSARIEKWIFG